MSFRVCKICKILQQNIGSIRYHHENTFSSEKLLSKTQLRNISIKYLKLRALGKMSSVLHPLSTTF